MAIQIGRLAYFGWGIEGTPGNAVAPDVYIPFSDGPTLRGHHEAIEIIASKTSRFMDKDSVVGKTWSEGDIKMDLDVVNSGYLFKVALGNEVLTTGTPNNHEFYTTASGNAPKTATIRYGRGTDNEQFTYAAIDELTMEVSDGLASLTASIQGRFPTNCAEQTATTTSGTVFSFKDMGVRFGADLAAAAVTSATAVNSFSITHANNLETIHRSGSSDVSLIRTKGAKVTGSYTLFFDNITDRDAYYALSKRAMEIKFTGNANEELRIRIPEFRLSEGEIATGLDDFFVINAEFTAEDDVDSGARVVDVRLQNDKGTVY